MNCLFCKIINGDIPANIVFNNDDFIGFKDINPQSPTHILLIPKIHLNSINDSSDTQALMLGKMMLTAKEIAEKENISEDGYRLVINTNEHGGQTVNHLHIHILGGRKLTWPPG